MEKIMLKVMEFVWDNQEQPHSFKSVWCVCLFLDRKITALHLALQRHQKIARAGLYTY